MSIRERRLEKGWSQEQLAQMTGLSVRTVQRIEQGQKAGLESLKCLAAVFETNVSDLMKQNGKMNDKLKSNVADQSGKIETHIEAEAIEYVKNLKGFHINWMTYIVIIPALYVLNVYITPGYLWVVWPAMGWGFAIILHAVTLFGLFGVLGAEWEQKQFEKRMRQHHRY